MNVDFDPSDPRPLYPHSDQTADIERGRGVPGADILVVVAPLRSQRAVYLRSNFTSPQGACHVRARSQGGTCRY
jgi:hypothetical protein